MNWYTGSIVSRMLKFGSTEPYQHDDTWCILLLLAHSQKIMRRFFLSRRHCTNSKTSHGKGSTQDTFRRGWDRLPTYAWTLTMHRDLGWSETTLTRLCRHGEKTCFFNGKKKSGSGHTWSYYIKSIFIYISCLTCTIVLAKTTSKPAFPLPSRVPELQSPRRGLCRRRVVFWASKDCPVYQPWSHGQRWCCHENPRKSPKKTSTEGESWLF